jgi:hypothetical protein
MLAASASGEATMTPRHNFFRHAVRPALGPGLALCAALSACTGNTATPQAFASVNLGAYYDMVNHNGANTCKSYMSLREVFAIGTATGNCDPKTGVCNGTGPVRVKDGESQNGGAPVNIRCTVNGNYDVNLEASLGNTGTLSIVGHVDATAGGKGLSADIGYQSTHYSGNDCTVTFMYGGMDVPQHPPVASGRIWAHLSCPQMGDPDGVRHVVLMDMSLVPEVCDGEVDFIFENCST